jgi:hypothetical protein
MNVELRFHPEAEKEVLRSAAWYAERSPVAGQAFLLELDLVVERILEAPERWLLSVHRTRRIVFPRFPLLSGADGFGLLDPRIPCAARG